MKMKKYLTDLIARKRKQQEELVQRSDASQDINEVREIGRTLETVRSEIVEAEAALAELQNEGQDNGEDGTVRSAPPVPQNAELRNASVLGAFHTAMPQQRSADPYDTPEYRSAFMEYVCRGTAIPAELRADGITTAADAGAAIPTTYLNEIVTKASSYGSVYAKVRKLNVQGGVSIPILSLVPTATWIGETAPSADQKIQANTSVTFSYFGLECKIAQSLLVNVATLDAFQRLFVDLATEAIVKALEIGVFKGTGTNQMTGILTDTRVPASNVITLSAEDAASWEGWKGNVFAKMKKAYRKGEFFMAQSTFDTLIDGMVDAGGQPIGRVNYGTENGEIYRFGGKMVETVEDDVITPYSAASSGDVIAVFADLSNYAVNSNLQMQVTKWVDQNSNEVKNKCILICDGKLIDPNGVLIIKKGG